MIPVVGVNKLIFEKRLFEEATVVLMTRDVRQCFVSFMLQLIQTSKTKKTRSLDQASLFDRVTSREIVSRVDLLVFFARTFARLVGWRQVISTKTKVIVL